jgi:hypothetical protein
MNEVNYIIQQRNSGKGSSIEETSLGKGIKGNLGDTEMIWPKVNIPSW